MWCLMWCSVWGIAAADEMFVHKFAIASSVFLMPLQASRLIFNTSFLLCMTRLITADHKCNSLQARTALHCCAIAPAGTDSKIKQAIGTRVCCYSPPNTLHNA